MIKAGKYICHICGRISSRAYYHNQANRNGVLLRRRGRGYTVEAVPPGSHDPADLAPERYALSPNNNFGDDDFKSGLPDRIEVLQDGSSTSITMFRCCPECTVHTNLFSKCGMAPTYSIAIVGGGGAGKSAWLEALGEPSNVTLLDRAHYPYKIQFKATPESGQLDGTPPGAEFVGSTRYLTIEENTTDAQRRICAGVLLRDFGGELFDGHLNLAQPELDRLLKQNSLGGPDAYLLFLNGDEADQNRFIAAWSTLTEKYLSMTKKPIVGVIVTHADKMVGKPIASGSGRHVLLTDKTFSRGQSYDRDSVIKRIDLEDMIARTYSGQIEVIQSNCKAAKGFIVKSCRDISAREAQYAYQGINVYDPLLWILNQLGIFPWQ